MFHGSEWRGGTWRGGEWQDGNWYDGEWRGGTWHGGNWYGGDWHDGTWYGRPRDADKPVESAAPPAAAAPVPSPAPSPVPSPAPAPALKSYTVGIERTEVRLAQVVAPSLEAVERWCEELDMTAFESVADGEWEVTKLRCTSVDAPAVRIVVIGEEGNER